MYTWETLYKEKIKPKDMSSAHITSVVVLLEKKNKSIHSRDIGNLNGELNSRKTLVRTSRYTNVLDTIKNEPELDSKFYKNYMNYIIKNPDLFQELFYKHKIPVDILVIYQEKILWSNFFWCNRNRIDTSYLMDIIQSTKMTDSKWAMIIRSLDLDEDFLNSIFDFVPPAFLIGQELSFGFWKNNIHRIFVFDMNDAYSNGYKKKELVWRELINNYKDSITASFIDRCKYYIPKSMWGLISNTINLSDDYVISLKDFIDINKISKKRGISDRVLYECRNNVDWANINYKHISDKAIVKLKDYVSWMHVFESWSEHLDKPKTESDRKDFKRTGDILAHKNLVDWEGQLVKWGLYDKSEISIMGIIGGSRRQASW